MEKLKIPDEIIDRMDELAKENWVEYGEEGGMLTGFGFDGVMVKNIIDSQGNTLNYLNVFNRNKIIVEK